MLLHVSGSGNCGKEEATRLRYEVCELDDLVSTFFAIFYVKAYLASRDTEFLQRALDILVSLFERVG